MKNILTLYFALICAFSFAQSGGNGGSRQSATSAVSAERTSSIINQTAHGLTVCSLVYFNGASFLNANANSLATSKVIGIISKVINANSFEITTTGYFDGCTGLTPGADYYLSATTAGAYTTVAPSLPNQSVQVFKAISGNELIMSLVGDGGNGSIVEYSSSVSSSTSPIGTTDVTWTGVVGTIVNNGTLFTLLAGKTYRLQAGMSLNFNTGSTVSATYQFLDASNNQIGANPATVYNISNGNSGDSPMGFTAVTYTPSVNTQVKVRITGSGAVSGATINRANLSIIQLGSVASIANQSVNVVDLPIGGALQASLIDPYVLGFNVAQTTASQVLTIPSPITTAVNRILYINNVGAVDFKIGTITVGINRTVAYIWNGTTWSNFSTEVVGGVLAEYGENTTMTDIQTTNLTSFADVAGSSFVIPSAGVWKIDYQVFSRNNTSAASNYFRIVDNAGVYVTNTFAEYSQVVDIFTVAPTGNSIIITTTGASTYKIQWAVSSGTATLFNNATLVAGRTGNSKITYQKISGYLPIVGTSTSYLQATRITTNQTISGGWANKDIIFNNSIGNIPYNTTTGIASLTGGVTYNIKAGLSWANGTNYLTQYNLVDGVTNAIISPTIEMVQATNGGFNISPYALDYIYTPSVNQTVKIRMNSFTSLLSGEQLRADLFTYFQITQIGSTPTIENQAVNVTDLLTGGAIQALPIDAYVLGFNVNQTTASQYVSIPLPISTSVNRIIYINNTGTVSFNIGTDIIQPNKTIGYIWNGTLWSVFGEQSVGAVIGEFGENNSMTNGQTSTSTSFVDVAGGSFTLPSAGVWKVNYNIFTKNSSAAGLVKFILTDANNVIVPNSNASYEQVTGVDIIAPVGQISFITTAGSATYKLRWLVSTSTGTIYNNGSLGSIEAGNSKITYQKVSGYLPVIGQTVDNILTGLTAGQNVPSAGSPFTLIAKTGSGLSAVSNQVVLNGGKSYKMLGTIARMNGSGGSAEIAYQFRDITNNVYLGNEGMATQNTALGGGSTAMADIVVPYGTTVTVQLWVTKNINAGSLTLNGIGTGGAGSFYVYQDGSSAYTSLNPVILSSGQVTGILPITSGGTGSLTQNFVDLTNAQNIAGSKTFTNNLIVSDNILATSFTKSGGLASQNLLADGTVFDKYNSSVSSAVYFQNSTLATTLINGMSITPPLAGTYKIDFNTQFNTQLANVTQQAVIDLNALYLNLNSQATTGTFPTFLTGTTIVAGVYYTPVAVAATGTITLNGGGNANSIFIFKTDAAFSTAASCVFNLINGASAKNIFFIAGGAISIGANSNISGTFLSSSGAVGVGASAYITGRIYSIGSPITANGSVLLSPASTIFPMGVLSNFVLFTTAGAVTNVGANTFVGDIGTNNGVVTGFGGATVSGNIYLPNQGASIVSMSIYVDNVLVATSTRERVNTIDKIDVILTETVILTAGQVVSIRVLNSIGISRFYNRNLTVTKL